MYWTSQHSICKTNIARFGIQNSLCNIIFIHPNCTRTVTLSNSMNYDIHNTLVKILFFVGYSGIFAIVCALFSPPNIHKFKKTTLSVCSNHSSYLFTESRMQLQCNLSTIVFESDYLQSKTLLKTIDSTQYQNMSLEISVVRPKRKKDI